MSLSLPKATFGGEIVTLAKPFINLESALIIISIAFIKITIALCCGFATHCNGDLFIYGGILPVGYFMRVISKLPVWLD